MVRQILEAVAELKRPIMSVTMDKMEALVNIV